MTSRSLSSTIASSISIGGTLSSCRSMFGCLKIWFIWYTNCVCTWQTGGWVLNQPNDWWLGGWSTSSFWTTRHPVAGILNLTLLMHREILDPSQARLWIRKLRQTGQNQQNIGFLLASIETRNLPLQQRSRSCFPFLAVIRCSIGWSWRHTIPWLIIFLQEKQRIHHKSKNFNYKYSTVFSKYSPMYSREDSLPRRVLEASKTCQSCRVLYRTSWLLQTEPLVLVTF